MKTQKKKVNKIIVAFIAILTVVLTTFYYYYLPSYRDELKVVIEDVGKTIKYDGSEESIKGIYTFILIHKKYHYLIEDKIIVDLGNELLRNLEESSGTDQISLSLILFSHLYERKAPSLNPTFINNVGQLLLKRRLPNGDFKGRGDISIGLVFHALMNVYQITGKKEYLVASKNILTFYGERLKRNKFNEIKNDIFIFLAFKEISSQRSIVQKDIKRFQSYGDLLAQVNIKNSKSYNFFKFSFLNNYKIKAFQLRSIMKEWRVRYESKSMKLGEKIDLIQSLFLYESYYKSGT